MVNVCPIIDEKRKEKAWSACVREEKKFVTQDSTEWAVVLLVKRILEGVHFDMDTIPVAILVPPS